MTAVAAGELASLVPEGALRPATGEDAIDGVTPAQVVEPPTEAALAAVLAWCTANRQNVVIRGGGTKLGWGRTPASVDLVVSTRLLAGISRYEPGDLTVSVSAGTTIEDLNQHLSARGQWLPIDSRGDQSTIGGAIATNDSGPLRHRYGTPRDQLIGVRLAMADGRLASAGGNVVKNVAGYDLGKFITGSFGSLAAIVGATFKLAPVPAATTTLIASFRDRADLAGAAAEIAASQLDPMGLEIDASGPDAGGGRRGSLHVLTRFGGVAAGVREQAAAAAKLVAPFGPIESEQMADEADNALWSHRGRRIWNLPGAVVKVSWMPAALADVIALLDDLRSRTGAEIELAGRAALGTGLVRIAAEPAAEIAVVEALRGGAQTVGHVVVVRGGAELKARVDVWGLSAGTAAVTKLVKQVLDPAGVLNAARGPA